MHHHSQEEMHHPLLSSSPNSCKFNGGAMPCQGEKIAEKGVEVDCNVDAERKKDGTDLVGCHPVHIDLQCTLEDLSEVACSIDLVRNKSSMEEEKEMSVSPINGMDQLFHNNRCNGDTNCKESELVTGNAGDEEDHAVALWVKCGQRYFLFGQVFNGSCIGNHCQELRQSVLWDKIEELRNASVQPELVPEWKTWKQEVMKLYFSSYPSGNAGNHDRNSCFDDPALDQQVSRKRPKLEVRRGETQISHMGDTNCRALSEDPNRMNLPINSVRHETIGALESINQNSAVTFPGNSGGQEMAESSSANPALQNARVELDSLRNSRQCSAYIEAKEVHKKETRWLFRGYSCAACMESFTNRKVLERHVQERHGAQYLQYSTLIRCMSCDSNFLNTDLLWQHIVSDHAQDFKLLNVPQRPKGRSVQRTEMTSSMPLYDIIEKDGSEKFTCRLCGLIFDLLPDLGRHHQVSHMNQGDVDHIQPGRGKYQTKPHPSNLDILSVARSVCCKTSLLATLEAKYGCLPENMYVKAAKLCSDSGIQIDWHQEEFLCPSGCKSISNSNALLPIGTTTVDLSETPLTDPSNDHEMWGLEEYHYVLDSEPFRWKLKKERVVLCEDISFSREKVPIVCVIDVDAKDSLLVKPEELLLDHSVPWQGFHYSTERLMDSSLVDPENSMARCACSYAHCSPEKCDHVSIFDRSYENLVDIYGTPMRGRFAYDENGKIILQGWAIRAAEPIPRGTFVCEYIGEVVKGNDVMRNAEREAKVGCSYQLNITSQIDRERVHAIGTVLYMIDATRYGNVSRFINHSIIGDCAYPVSLENYPANNIVMVRKQEFP
ncbi:hypothetical protein PR202_gb09524 [Eleusine coracana subsp. coracana]|uniref:Uncharacterized protein n=1 Tax=Eleusine coracana subsp. coracana TaxID=191504 RepID=A0AAV5EFU9_ELECO|nr:hypothetical protein PR202_gb09524 [Eleusine coracana subsp. coracana]